MCISKKRIFVGLGQPSPHDFTYLTKKLIISGYFIANAYALMSTCLAKCRSLNSVPGLMRAFKSHKVSYYLWPSFQTPLMPHIIF